MVIQNLKRNGRTEKRAGIILLCNMTASTVPTQKRQQKIQIISHVLVKKQKQTKTTFDCGL